MARVTRMHGGYLHTKNVKNLGWFFRHARNVVIEKFDMWQSNDGWEMFVDFADGHTFATHYADLSVFKHVMSRQRSLKGYTVNIHHEDGSVEHFKIERKLGRRGY